MFTVGGTVQAGSGAYLKRAVDDDLLALCRAGAIAYVLSARQMGKSSLMVHTAERLQAEGIATAVVDLNEIGTNVTPDRWYIGLLSMIESRLDLDVDTYAWWTSHESISPAQRLMTFFREVVLGRGAGRVVVFIDEIDSTLSLDFTDDFFAAVRSMYNARSIEPSFSRLSFVLVGVATPGDLIGDSTRTPFNIGQGVNVGYFTEKEALPLVEGFDLPESRAHQALKWILDWTGGHPFLTQRLCSVVAASVSGTVSKDDIDRAVREAYFGDRSQQDANLRFVQDMLTRRAPDQEAVLKAYRSIVAGRKVVDVPQSPVHAQLKLAGIVRPVGSHLRVSNRIYATVFDARWLAQHRSHHWIRSVPPVVRGLVAASFVAVIAIAGLILARIDADRAQRGRADLDRLNAKLQLSNDSLAVANREAVRAGRRADSLNAVAESANADLVVALQRETEARSQLLDANELLTAAVAGEQAARRELEVANASLQESVSDNEALNRQLTAALAEERSAALRTRVLVIANEAMRMARRGNGELAALLARRAWLLADSTEGIYGDVLLAALRDATNLLSVDRGEPRSVRMQGGIPLALSVDPAGRDIVVGAEDGTIERWQLGESLRQTHRAKAHVGPVRAILRSRSAFDLISAGADGQAHGWVFGEEGRVVNTVIGTAPGSIDALSEDPTGRWLVAVGSAGQPYVWDLADLGLQPVTPGPSPDPSTGPVGAVTFGGDGGRIAWAGDDGTIKVWTPGAPEAAVIRLRTRLGAIHALAFRPGTDHLAAAGSNAGIEFWSVGGSPSGWTALPGLEGHASAVTSLSFDRAGTTLFSGSRDGTVLAWNLDQPTVAPLIVESFERQVSAISTTADGRTVVTGGSDGLLHVWSLNLEALADRLCSLVRRGELTRAEWDEFIGSDRDYLEAGSTCPDAIRPALGIERRRP